MNMTKFELQAITACFFFVYSMVCPNGLIANLFGPVAGQHHHDAFMLHESNLLLLLQAKFAALPIFTLYGGPAYLLCQRILRHYRGAHLTPDQQLFNKKNEQSLRIYRVVFWKSCLGFCICGLQKEP